jgi:hypothetical protein
MLPSEIHSSRSGNILAWRQSIPPHLLGRVLPNPDKYDFDMVSCLFQLLPAISSLLGDSVAWHQDHQESVEAKRNGLKS